jgi:predicted transposase YbfD/YdcC
MFEFMAELPDPRVERTRRHDLLEIIVITVLAVVCGADDWDEVWQFADSRERWLKTFLELRHGIPSESTFRRVFRALNATAFREAFLAWTTSLVGSTDGKLVAIDGKTLRRSFTKATKTDSLHIVSAWVAENRVVFGQVATDAKSNEITAIPKLLEMLDLRGATVTIDAMGCQKRIVKAIVAGKADYVIAVKDNQPTLAQDIEAAFVTAEIAEEPLPIECTFEQTNKGHGRTETRRITALDAADRLGEKQLWDGLQSIVRVESHRTLGDKTSTELRYYITSLGADAALLATRIRAHWGIENGQHWTLDVAFAEDQSRIRRGNGPDNFATVRRMALNLIKADKTLKCGVKARRKRAGWDDEYLFRVLQATATGASPEGADVG